MPSSGNDLTISFLKSVLFFQAGNENTVTVTIFKLVGNGNDLTVTSGGNDAHLCLWVSQVYGVPAYTSQQIEELSFTAAAWAAMCSSLGGGSPDNHCTVYSTSCHPQSNGLAERFHRQLKEALRARECEAGWLAVSTVVWVMLGIRAAPMELAGVPAAVFGAPLTLPGQLVRQPEPLGQPVIPGPMPRPQQQELEPGQPLDAFLRRLGKAAMVPMARRW
jgi:hypothetical protein